MAVMARKNDWKDNPAVPAQTSRPINGPSLANSLFMLTSNSSSEALSTR
jgi:hypothetical protein